MQGNETNDYLQPDKPAKCLYNKNDLTNNPHPTVILNTNEKIFPNISCCIGNTPLVKLNRIPESLGIKCDVLVKCEFLNPGGSIKDRVAYSMIQDAEKRGLLKPGYTMIEPTSGNTGISLAMIGTVRGYDSVFVLPEKSSAEKQDILKALGVKVVRVSNKLLYNQAGGIFCKPVELQREIPNSIIMNQFYNPSNPLSHYYGTSHEIIEQCDGQVDMLVMGVGTGGTVTGMGRKFKELLPKCVIVGVDPYGSTIAEPPSINETDVTYFEIEGIGHNYHPTTLDKKVVDFWLKVHDKDSLNMARRLHKEEGILCGASSGTILCGGLEAAKSLKEGEKCVVVLPDGVGNYLTKFLLDYWMEVRNFIPCKNTFNHWWWDLDVSLLNPNVSLSISKIGTCQEAMDIMNSQNHNVLPVVDDNKILQGVVNAKDLMRQFFNSEISPNDSVEKVMSEKYRTVTPNSKLGILSRILDNEGVAIVVEEHQKVLNQQNHKLIGILFAADFLEYINKNHP